MNEYWVLYLGDKQSKVLLTCHARSTKIKEGDCRRGMRESCRT